MSVFYSRNSRSLTCTVAKPMLDSPAPPGLSLAMALKTLYFESRLLLNVDSKDMIPVSDAIENFVVPESE